MKTIPKRLAAAAAFLPLIAACVLWSMLVQLSQRGPAGDVGSLIVLLPILPILYLLYRLIRGSLAPWSWPVRVAIGLDFLLLVWFWWARVAVRSGFLSAQEGETRSRLSAVRAVLVREVKAGRPPPRRLSALVPERLEMIPTLALPGTDHPMTREVRFARSTELADSGKWLYVNDPKDLFFGMIRIDCTHTDSRGLSWSAY
ncbi:MAG: hypothetical protein V3S11_03805 [Elusimicrobiota bacterium]